MGVIMGKIIMNNTENQTQLILQAGDEESLKRQVDGIDMLERKAKAFDEIRNVDKDFYKEYGYYPNEEEWWYDASNIIEKYEELHGGQIK